MKTIKEERLVRLRAIAKLGGKARWKGITKAERSTIMRKTSNVFWDKIRTAQKDANKQTAFKRGRHHAKTPIRRKNQDAGRQRDDNA